MWHTSWLACICRHFIYDNSKSVVKQHNHAYLRRKHSGHYVYTCFNVQAFYFAHRVCLCVLMILRINKPIISQNINWLAFVMEMQCFLCEVGTAFLYIAFRNIERVKTLTLLFCDTVLLFIVFILIYNNFDTFFYGLKMVFC